MPITIKGQVTMLEIVRSETLDVVQLAGRFDGAGSALFDQQFRATESTALPCVLDFGGITYLSSAGIRSLVWLEKKLRSKGSRLILVALQAPVMQTLEMSGLLNQFAVAASVDKAHDMLREASSGISATGMLSLGGHPVTIRRLPASATQVEVWGAGATLSTPDDISKALLNATLSEIPLAIGRGGFGHNREQAMESLGTFLTADQSVILSPEEGPGYSDFLQSEKPEAVSFYVSEAVSIRGRPALYLHFDGTGTTLGEFTQALPSWIETITGKPFALAAFLLHTSSPSENASASEDMLALGVALGAPDGTSDLLRKFRPQDWQALSPSAQALGCGIRLAGSIPVSDAREPEAVFKEALSADRFLNVTCIQPETPLGHVKAWIYLPTKIVSSDEARLQIEIKNAMVFPDEWDLITRRIYTDARRVVLTQMSGGYSATTLHADSYDAEGRRMIPTVLKISSLHVTQSEVRAYHDHVKRFILNNSTVIMGHASQGNWSGLRYNFVGVNGAGSSLSWLANHYARRPVETLKPLFHSVFGQVLWPWYGQPKREQMRPFEQHDPSTLFPSIPEQAEKTMGISSDQPLIMCEELGRELPNPYYFLRHDFPKLKTWQRPWYSTITHGDLNLNNILIDEKDNIYIIDFSETRPRNALSDFARIEPVITLQMTRLEEPSDGKDLLLFLEGLASVSPLKENPPLRYAGTDPMVEKAWHIVCLLREHGRKVVANEDQAIFYWLPLLEWTIPSVYFQQLSPERKRIWMFAAGLLCEQIRKQV